MLVTIASYFLLWYIALPQSDSTQTTEILGKELKAIKRKDSLLQLSTQASNENQQEDSENIYAVIGHRGAGLDAPENSLSAIRQVLCFINHFEKQVNKTVKCLKTYFK